MMRSRPLLLCTLRTTNVLHDYEYDYDSLMQLW